VPRTLTSVFEGSATLLVILTAWRGASRQTRNLQDVECVTWHGVNVLSLLRKRKLLIDLASLEMLQRGILFPLASTPGTFTTRPEDLPRFDPQLPPKYLTPKGQRQLRKVHSRLVSNLGRRPLLAYIFRPLFCHLRGGPLHPRMAGDGGATGAETTAGVEGQAGRQEGQEASQAGGCS
jgi:hypothetical protein